MQCGSLSHLSLIIFVDSLRVDVLEQNHKKVVYCLDGMIFHELLAVPIKMMGSISCSKPHYKLWCHSLVMLAGGIITEMFF